MGEPAVQLDPVYYPESDGQPMAETDLHRDEMADTIALLKRRYQDDPSVYVAGNLLVYYEEGQPDCCFAPDVFVVRGVPKHRRRIYRLWVEKQAPAFVLEVTFNDGAASGPKPRPPAEASRKTRLDDKGGKRELCAELGVPEYFLFDPEADYLKPPLQGFRLQDGRYEPIAADALGRVPSEVLALLLTRDAEGRLRFVDPASGEQMLRLDELADHETARADAAEAEIARLRALLEKPRVG